MEQSRIHAVEHVHMETRASLEEELIWFYGELSGLDLISSWSEGGSEETPQLRFKSAKLELRLKPVEHPRVDAVARRLTLVVPSIAEVEEQLDERGIPFDRITGLSGGEHVVMVLDPTGHRVLFKQESPRL